MSVGNVSVSELVRRHYQSVIGPPSAEERFSLDVTVSVLTWRAGDNPHGLFIYATLGASAFPLPPDLTHRIEMHVVLSRPVAEIGRRIAAAAMFHEKEIVDSGHTITFDEPLWPGGNMRTLWLINQSRLGYEHLVPKLILPEAPVEFLMAVPVFPSEVEFKREFGSERLWDEFARLRVPFQNPDRPAAQLSIPR